MMRVVVIGAGTYGEVYLSYLRESSKFKVVGFLDDNPDLVGKLINNVPVLGTTDILAQCKDMEVAGVIVPIGNTSTRVRLFEKAKRLGLCTPNYIHPQAIVSNDAQIGDGVYILPNTVIMPHVVIHDYVMISVGVNVIHHAVLQKGVFLSNGVNLGAGVTVDECAYVGMGATVMTGVKSIGRYSMIGAGAVVIRDVPEATTVAGVPAKPLKSA